MNDKTAYNKLKKINDQRNADGVGGYRNSRRDKVRELEILNEALKEFEVKKVR